MTSDDYERFMGVLKTLATVFRATSPLTDDEVKFYWDALKDRPLADIERRAEKYGKRGKFYPKPADLRPKSSDEEGFEETDGAHRRFEQLNRESEALWNQRLLEDPIGTKLALCDALEARYSTEKDQSSLILAEKREWLNQRRAQLKWQLTKGRGVAA